VTTPLPALSSIYGQSPWLDNLKRAYLLDGSLARLVARGVRGVTANPTIFLKAISGSHDYDAAFATLIKSGMTTADAYWELVIDDVTGACVVLHGVYTSSDGIDGYVSLEVSPRLAHDPAGTAAAARQLHERMRLDNLMVKIPATAEGVAAITQMISEGRNVNVTLIFSLDRYAEVIEAYLAGLETQLGAGVTDLSLTASVASFSSHGLTSKLIGDSMVSAPLRHSRSAGRPASLKECSSTSCSCVRSPDPDGNVWHDPAHVPNDRSGPQPRRRIQRFETPSTSKPSSGQIV
jgi:transaldolase